VTRDEGDDSHYVEKFRENKGATAIEYGLLAGLIAVMIIAGATLTGTSLSAMFNAIAAGFRRPSRKPKQRR